MDFVKYGVGWIIAIGFGIAGLYYFLYNRRRKKLEVNARSRSLTTALVRDNSALQIMFNDVQVIDPHIVGLSVTNTCHKDIASKDFDADKPYRVDTGATIVASLEISEKDTDSALDIDPITNRHILLRPTKIAVGDTLRIRVLVEGAPEISFGENPLIDTDIVRGLHERSKMQKASRRARGWILSLAIPFILATFIPLALIDETTKVKGDWFIFSNITVGPTWLVVCGLISTGLGVTILALMPYSIYKTARLGAMMERIADLG